MVNKFKNKLKVKDNRVLLSNFFSLSALQIASYFFPLLTFPYLVRVLGVELFGLLAIASALIIYFEIITDYGFDLTATKEISVHRDDKFKVIEIFSSVITIKFLLMFLSIFLLSIVVFSIEKFSQNWEIYYFTFGTVIGQVLFPVWFFQGMEKMKYITVLTIFSKLIFTLSIFIFVQDENDFFMVPLLNGIGSIVAGFTALYIINKDFEVTFVWQKPSIIKYYFQEGWEIFVQRFYVTLYSTTNTMILGFLTNDKIVGSYAIAERIITIFKQLFQVVSAVYYPYFAKKFVFDQRKALDNLKKVSLVMLVLSVSAMAFVFLLDEFIIKIIVGAQYDKKITTVLGILTFGIILLPFFTLFTAVLVAINESKALKVIARDTALMSIVLSPLLIFFLQERGLAFLVVFLQVTIIFRYSKVIFRVYKSMIQESKR